MKTKFTIKTLPYLTRKELIDIADNGERWDYNRQLCPEAIRRLPNDSEIVYPITIFFFHEHRCFEPCELHMRLVVSIPGSTATADVPLDFFEALPKSNFVICEKRIVAVLLEKPDRSPWKLRYKNMNRMTGGAIRHLLKKSKNQHTKAFLNNHLHIVESAT